MAVRLDRPPRFAVVQPADIPELALFSCAPRTPAEQEAQDIVRAHAGIADLGHGAGVVTAREPETNTLVGVAVFKRATLRKYIAGVLIDVVALAGPFRGCYVRRRSDLVADRLLRRVLRQTTEGSSVRPHHWAAVSRGHKRSERLLGNAGFENAAPYGLAAADADIWFLAGDEPL